MGKNVRNSSPEYLYEEEDYDMDEDTELDLHDMPYEGINWPRTANWKCKMDWGGVEEDIFWHMKWFHHVTSLTSSPEEEDLHSICLDEYVEGQNIGELDCEHKFHHDCVRE